MSTQAVTSIVWALLMALTILSWGIGGNGVEPAAPEARGTVIVLLVVAFAKARLVIRHFMEVRHAPRPLRLATDAWVFGVCGLLVGLYLIAA